MLLSAGLCCMRDLCSYVLESRKYRFSSVMKDLLSKYFSRKSLGTKLAVFSVFSNSLDCSLKKEGYNLKPLYNVEEQRK